jgi:hypothetical protein
MKKLAYCLITLIICCCALVFFGKNYLPGWISTKLSEKMGVPVWMNRISITPHTTQIHSFKISNPSGFILDTALQARSIEAQAPVYTFFKEHVVVDLVTVSDLYVGLEFASATNTTGNWTIIVNNLQNALNQSNVDTGKTFLIKLLSVNNIKIDLIFIKNDGKIRHLKPISHMQFRNVSSNGPFPMEQLTKIIMSEVLKKIFLENNLKNMLQDAFQNPAQGVLKSLFSLEEEKILSPPLLRGY